MIYVYVLESISMPLRYVGMTNNLDQRLKQHNHGNTPSTRFYRPFKITN
jgi:predicted GIY-YIG superfamily endonuclease